MTPPLRGDRSRYCRSVITCHPIRVDAVVDVAEAQVRLRQSNESKLNVIFYVCVCVTAQDSVAGAVGSEEVAAVASAAGEGVGSEAEEAAAIADAEAEEGSGDAAPATIPPTIRANADDLSCCAP
jgi:hypothetical protein